MPRREDHEVHKGHVVALEKKRKKKLREEMLNCVHEIMGFLRADLRDAIGQIV